MSYFSELKTELEKYCDDAQLLEIESAYRLARNAHRGQRRRSGEAYITHPVAAATILAKLRLDYQSIMATLLHDTIEDTKVTKDQLERQFGSQVAELVDGVSKLGHLSFSTRAEAQAENFRKMVLAMVRDIRVILVKLADRLHNMRTLGVMPVEKKRRIARETLDIYAPIANRLGMHWLYTNLEDLGFKALYPMRFAVLDNAVNKARGNRQKIIETILHAINQSLGQFQVTAVEAHGRKKHLYSIFKKMRFKNTPFAEIMDVYGFRIIVQDVAACYQALGAIHNTYKPLPERFKDYIAIPKSNGYQSLHTTLFGPFGVPIEVQIRTHDMHKIAENGIAAHWLYKSSGLDANTAQMRARKWVKGLVEMQQSADNSLEFIENVKIDLFPDEVYVFTPKGQIMELPKGATPVDFAYLVHSDIGNTCVAAKVDRRLAPLSTPLANGQHVEIITAPGASPNPAWLNYVVTGKARSNIRHFLKSQCTAESIDLGKRMLVNALGELGSLLTDIKTVAMDNLLKELQLKVEDDLFEAVAQGNQVALVIAQRLTQKFSDNDRMVNTIPQALSIKGTEGMVVHYAECCYPIPGDPIIGQLKPGQGVVVHMANCSQIKAHHPNKTIALCWADNVEGEYDVDIFVEVVNQRGVLALLAGAVADAEGNICNVSVDPEDGNHNKVFLTISVRDRTHLARIMRRIRSVPVVVKINRKKPNE